MNVIILFSVSVGLRLVEGNTPFDGVVEVKIGRFWERVCQMGWSFQMADFVCHHIGKFVCQQICPLYHIYMNIQCGLESQVSLCCIFPTNKKKMKIVGRDLDFV